MLNLDPSATSNLATDSKALRDIARDAALKVAPPLLAAFRSRMTIDYKVDLHDPVTESDRQSEATIREHLGDLYSKLGDMAKARKYWQEALRLSNETEETARIKGKLKE